MVFVFCRIGIHASRLKETDYNINGTQGFDCFKLKKEKWMKPQTFRKFKNAKTAKIGKIRIKLAVICGSFL